MMKIIDYRILLIFSCFIYGCMSKKAERRSVSESHISKNSKPSGSNDLKQFNALAKPDTLNPTFPKIVYTTKYLLVTS